MNKIIESACSFLCPYCGGKKEHFFCSLSSKINRRNVNYYACKKCGALIQFPYPDKKILSEYYEAYFEIKQKLNTGYLTESQYASFKSERDKTLAELCFDKERIKNGVNVELGCANGFFLRYLKENGAVNILGIDTSLPLLKNARQQLNAQIISEDSLHDMNKMFRGSENIRLACASSLDGIAENTVDNLYMFHLMEHSAEPDILMKQAACVLKKDGIFILEVPVSGLVSSFFHDKWRFLMPDEHLNIPSVRSVKILAAHYGFSIISLTRFGSGVTAGTAPHLVKKIADKSAKIFKIGDRAAFLLIKK